MNPFSELASRVRTEFVDTPLAANSSDKAISFETDSNWLNARSFDHEPVAQRDGRADGRNLCIPANHRNEMGLDLPGWIGNTSPIKRSRRAWRSGCIGTALPRTRVL